MKMIPKYVKNFFAYTRRICIWAPVTLFVLRSEDNARNGEVIIETETFFEAKDQSYFKSVIEN